MSNDLKEALKIIVFFPLAAAIMGVSVALAITIGYWLLKFFGVPL